MKLLEIDYKILNILIFIAAVALIITRHVDFFVYPRFWAEEATQYFYDAYNNGISAIWQEHKGYYSWLPSVAGYIATLVPLENAPLVTTLFAFLVQVIPFYLIFISNSPFLNSTSKKLLASAIILLIGNTPEIWLNSITSQFHFVIITFLLLIENKEKLSKLKINTFYILALLSGLSGIPANILAPFFLYTYFLTKEKMNLYLLSIFTFTTIVHLFFILQADRVHELSSGISYNVIANIIISFLQYPIFYSGKIDLDTLLVIPLLYIIIKFIAKKSYFELFFVLAFFLEVLMILTSWGMHGGQRYVYASSVIFMLGLLVAFFDNSLPKIIRILLFIYILTGLYHASKHYTLVHGKYYSKNWKNWHDQALLYKAHSIEKIRLYPPNWSVTLPRKNKK